MASDLPLIFCMGASHKSASIELRENLYISEEQLSTILPKTKDKFAFLELMAVSTCNRFEIYGVATRKHGVTVDLTEAYLEMQRLAEKKLKISEEEIISSTYLHTDNDAVRHAYRLASSLDSLVVGETQITGQFKDAVALASRIHTLGPLLSRLSQEALATAKKVRTQTEIGRRRVSISHAAIDLSKKVFGDLSRHSFLIVGAGEMAAMAAKYIKSYNPKGLYVVNRTKKRAEDMIAEVGFGEAYPMDSLPQIMGQVDIVISSTAAPGIVIDKSLVNKVQGSRRGRALCMIDIALPRDIAVDCGQIDDVYLFDIDDLQQVVSTNIDERKKAADQADALVESSLGNYRKWLETMAIKPILADFRVYLDDLFEREAERTLKKGFSEEQALQVQKMLKAIAGKIGGDAAKAINNPPEEVFQEILAEALRVMFAPTVEAKEKHLQKKEEQAQKKGDQLAAKVKKKGSSTSGNADTGT